MADQIDPQEDQTKDIKAVDTAPAEETPQEPIGDAEKAQEKEPATEEPKTDEPNAEESEEKVAEGESPEEPAQPSEDDEAAKKARNAEMAKRRIDDKKKLQRQFAEAVDTNYAPKTKDEFVEEGFDEHKAEIEALRQEVQFDKTRTYLAELNSGLKVDAQQVLSDFSIFDEKSPDYDAEFAQKTQERYERIARLEKTKLDDGSEIVTRAEEPLYDFFAEEVANYNRGKEQGQTAGQKDTLKMMSRSESPQNNTKPNTDKSADDMTIEEMEAKYGVVRG
jgi:hypothetical protein